MPAGTRDQILLHTTPKDLFLLIMETKEIVLEFYVNYKLHKVNPRSQYAYANLLQYLRSFKTPDNCLTGTKLGCGEGGCGACTVLLADMDLKKSKKSAELKVRYRAANACLVPLFAAHNKHVITIEALVSNAAQSKAQIVHPAQTRINSLFGSQCGFCTPGIVMSLYSLLRERQVEEQLMYNVEEDGFDLPSKYDLEHAFDGNLCRCTGYRPILDAAKSFAGNESVEGNSGIKSQRSSDFAPGTSEIENCDMDVEKCEKKHIKNSLVAWVEGQENEAKISGLMEYYAYLKQSGGEIKPCKKLLDKWDAELNSNSDVIDSIPYAKTRESHTWFYPRKISDILYLRHKYNGCYIVTGNTEVGVDIKYGKIPRKIGSVESVKSENVSYGTDSTFTAPETSIFVYPMEIFSLQGILKSDENGLEIGALTTLTDLGQIMESFLPRSWKDAQTVDSNLSHFLAIRQTLKWFAGRQIRNFATLSGNICTASPISDLNPIWVALGCSARVGSYENPEGRWIKMEDFFLGYRKTAMKTDEVLLSILIPALRSKKDFFWTWKQAKRRDDDIAIVNCGMKVSFDEDWKIQDLILAYGGMAAKTSIASRVRDVCAGKSWDEEVIPSLVSKLLVFEDLPIPFGVPGGMPEYRRSLASSLFFRFFYEASNALNIPNVSRVGNMMNKFSREISSGNQVYYQCDDEGAVSTVGKPIAHLSSLKQATGTARYTDDMLSREGEMYAAIVFSTKSRAKILSIDFLPALQTPGVHGFVSAKDLPEKNNIIGPVFQDEELFARDDVFFHGQILGVIVAENQTCAQVGAKAVKVQYEELKPILSIEDAISQNSFFSLEKKMERGNLDIGFKESAHIVEGQVRIGGQNHFYLETQASIAIPKAEDDEMEIIASTQNPTETQHLVAKVLGIPSHKVVCRVKRMGGGFGGKETRSVPLSCALAVAAKKFRRPIRCMLDRDEDMMLCGQRHPFLGKYRVGFNSEGKILALEVALFSNAGYSADLSIAVMERAVSHSDNVYMIPNVTIHGKVCKTNLHSNTAFRGFGGPQGMAVTETWMNHVAEYLNVPVENIRSLNMYKEGDTTHFNQRLENFQIPRIWSELFKKTDFETRKNEIIEFNETNPWIKRGISAIPTKFGIAFTARFLNQAGALVHVYTDGSVLLTHAGTEMGQGLFTKCSQICADALGIPLKSVHTSETSTDKVANTSPTAASAGSDLNGMAVLDACQQINKRLQPYKEKFPGKEFAEIVRMAYLDRVNLSANGFYKTPDLSYDWNTNSGRLFNYFTFGAAVSEVEIDVLTGDYQVKRTDIIMDLGQSLNPGLDIGQIEGAFIQGMGWCTMEETLHLSNGALFTKGPGNYKIPGFTDIPVDFRVSLLSDTQNSRAVHSSKAVGEPPLFLGTSVFFAIRDAIRSARKERGYEGYFRFDLPATSERIRMACEDEHTKLARSYPRTETEKPWFSYT